MVRIDDPDAFARLAQVEGERWAKLPETRQRLRSLAGAWREWPADYGSFLPEAIGIESVIYGASGYHRYKVTGSGEIIFLASFATDEGTARAKAAGFTVRGKALSS